MEKMLVFIFNHKYCFSVASEMCGLKVELHGQKKCIKEVEIISRKDSLMLFVKRLMQIDSLLHNLINCPKHVTEDGSAGKLWILSFILILL